MLLADYAVVSDGKLTIVGGGWSQTGPEPASFGIALLIQVPWDQSNTMHTFSVELLDADGAHVVFETPTTRRAGGRVRRRVRGRAPAGAQAGDAARLPGRVNSTPLPLEPGRYEWRLTIDDRPGGLERAVHRPWRGRVLVQVRPIRSVRSNHVRTPTRIDLLELDIDLRLTDLWREAIDVDEWNLEVVAAFIRAAYGKGYCDALTEESPGALCVEHGYRMPERPPERPIRVVATRPNRGRPCGSRFGPLRAGVH